MERIEAKKNNSIFASVADGTSGQNIRRLTYKCPQTHPCNNHCYRGVFLSLAYYRHTRAAMTDAPSNRPLRFKSRESSLRMYSTGNGEPEIVDASTSIG